MAFPHLILIPCVPNPYLHTAGCAKRAPPQDKGLTAAGGAGSQTMAAIMNFAAVPKAVTLRASSFRSGKAVAAKPAKAAVVASQPLKVSANLKVRRWESEGGNSWAGGAVRGAAGMRRGGD